MKNTLLFSLLITMTMGWFNIVHGGQPKLSPEVLSVMNSTGAFEEKIEKLKVMGKKENADAALALGLIYQLGLGGVAKDKVQSAEWFKKGAENGNEQAQYMIGTYYQGGIGVPFDLEKAAYWYRKALDNGVAEATGALKEIEKSMWLNKTGWVPIDTVCQSGAMDCSGPVMVTSNTSINHWAGEVIEAYHVKGSGSFTRFKISVAWITDRSPYSCGQIIEKRVDDVNDFKSRSFALRRCN